MDPVTPYSTILPYISGYPAWIPEEDQQRVASYAAYENIYWTIQDALKIIREADHGDPIYIPKPMTIVNTTAHYLMKGLEITIADTKKDAEFWKILQDFLKREKFYSRFQIAKHAGVVRGDWIMHITADPTDRPGSRVSLRSVDPAAYFPVYDTDDLDKRIGVRLVETQRHPDDPNKSIVKILEYGYTDSGLVWRTENLWEIEGWNDPKKAKKIKEILPLATLPPTITQIPVYHFKNAEWDGYPFGNSELKGFERILTAINQQVSDTDVALALAGLGVYATDAGRPVDDNGIEVDWVVSPGKVLEVPGATMFKRLEGISSVTSVYDHVNFLEQQLHEASGTSDVALGRIDVTTAESGIALAIKFMPTMAKIEYRDQSGLENLTQLFYDLKFWFWAYEGWNYTETEIIPKIGEKLPLNRTKMIEELNNMKDRKVISAKYYRSKMSELGYEFPENEEQQILDEIVAEQEARTPPQLLGQEGEGSPNQQGLPGPGGRKQGPGSTLPPGQKSASNNSKSGTTNESRGTEVKN